MPLRFAFHESKAVEALAYIAEEAPGFTPLYVSKILFFAEKMHLNKYGRPILADTYIAMPRGPVPSTVKNFIDSNWSWVDQPEDFDKAVTFDRSKGWARLVPGSRKANLEILSASDIRCLKAAIEFCKDKSPDELSQLTHREKAWLAAEVNGPMDYENFVDDDNPNKVAILAMAKDIAMCGVL